MTGRTRWIAVLAAMLMGGCSMPVDAQPGPPAGNQGEIARNDAGANAVALDAAVTTYLRDGYRVQSARYYRIAPDVPWVAVQKGVANALAP